MAAIGGRGGRYCSLGGDIVDVSVTAGRRPAASVAADYVAAVINSRIGNKIAHHWRAPAANPDHPELHLDELHLDLAIALCLIGRPAWPSAASSRTILHRPFARAAHKGARP